MLVSQARASRSGKARCRIACDGLPPGSGQSGLTTAGGNVTGCLASSGSGSSCRSSPSTEIRSPGSGCFLSLNQSQPARRQRQQQQRGEIASVHCR